MSRAIPLLVLSSMLLFVTVVPVLAQHVDLDACAGGKYETTVSVPCNTTYTLTIHVSKYSSMIVRIAPSPMPGGSLEIWIVDPRGTTKVHDKTTQEWKESISIDLAGDWKILLRPICPRGLASIEVGISIQGMGGAVPTTQPATTHAPPPPAGPSFPTWLLLAVGGGVAAIAVGVAVFLMLSRRKPTPPPQPVQPQPTTPTAPTTGAVATATAPTPASTETEATQVIGTEQMQTMVMLASLVLPDGRSIPITSHKQIFGRKDFEPYLPRDVLRFISRTHFAIYYVPGQGFFIEDLGSANGTFVNGQDIRGRGRVPLHEGDKINVAGVIELVFKPMPSAG